MDKTMIYSEGLMFKQCGGKPPHRSDGKSLIQEGLQLLQVLGHQACCC